MHVKTYIFSDTAPCSKPSHRSMIGNILVYINTPIKGGVVNCSFNSPLLLIVIFAMMILVNDYNEKHITQAVILMLLLLE